MFQSEAAGAADILVAEQKRDIGIPHGDAFEMIVICGHHVAEILAIIAIENHFAVSRAFDYDTSVGRATLGEVERSVEGRAIRGGASIEATVDTTIVSVEAGMYQDDVSRAHARRHHIRVVG